MNLIFLKRIIVLFYLIFLIDSKKIVFPFKETEINSNLLQNQSNLFFKKVYLNNIYTKIKIGNPAQLIIATFNSDNTHLILKDIPNLYNIEGYNTYNYENSKETFKNITSQNIESVITRGYSIINETVKLYKDKDYKNTVDIKNFQFELLNKFDYNNKSKTLSGVIGLKNDNENISFIKQLLNNGMIDSEIITMKYISDNEGYIYLGEEVDKSDDKNSIKMNNNFDSSLFQLEMDYVYIKYKNGRTFYSDRNLLFFFEQGLIFASNGYQKSIYEIFFKDKFEKELCYEEIINLGLDEYTAIICKNNIVLKNFPSLNFEINGNTFILDTNDLFKKVNNVYYFLAVFSPYIQNWIIGKPFLKKYQLTFDRNKNKAYYYINANKEKKNNAWVIVLIIFIILLILGILLFIFYKYKNNKKITNEDIDTVKGNLYDN